MKIGYGSIFKDNIKALNIPQKDILKFIEEQKKFINANSETFDSFSNLFDDYALLNNYSFMQGTKREIDNYRHESDLIKNYLSRYSKLFTTEQLSIAQLILLNFKVIDTAIIRDYERKRPSILLAV